MIEDVRAFTMEEVDNYMETLEGDIAATENALSRFFFDKLKGVIIGDFKISVRSGSSTVIHVNGIGEDGNRLFGHAFQIIHRNRRLFDEGDYWEISYGSGGATEDEGRKLSMIEAMAKVARWIRRGAHKDETNSARFLEEADLEKSQLIDRKIELQRRGNDV